MSKYVAMVGSAILAFLKTSKILDKDVRIERKVESENKNTFIVFQQELEDNLWAPRQSDTGREIFHWTNLTKVKKGDIIFSVIGREIVALNFAKREYNNSLRKDTFGYKVELDTNKLKNKINLDDRVNKILELSEEKYAPFNKNGENNIGYLFETGEKLGKFLLKEVLKENKIFL